MGRVLAAITLTSAGATAWAACSALAKWQKIRPGPLPNCATASATVPTTPGAGRGAGLSDLLMTLNLFSRVNVDAQGDFTSSRAIQGWHTSSCTRRWTRWWCSPPAASLDPPEYAPKPLEAQLDERRRQRRRNCRTSRPRTSAASPTLTARSPEDRCHALAIATDSA